MSQKFVRFLSVSSSRPRLLVALAVVVALALGGTVAGSPVAAADLPLPIYGVATLVIMGVCAAVLWLRYRSIPT